MGVSTISPSYTGPVSCIYIYIWAYIYERDSHWAIYIFTCFTSTALYIFLQIVNIILQSFILSAGRPHSTAQFYRWVIHTVPPSAGHPLSSADSDFTDRSSTQYCLQQLTQSCSQLTHTGKAWSTQENSTPHRVCQGGPHRAQ